MTSTVIRIGQVMLAVLAVAAAVVLGLWGTSWTVPRAPSSGAGYTLRATWDGAGNPSGALERPIGIDVSPMGHVYVTDALQRVVRFSPQGEVLGQWGHEGSGPGEFGNAVGVAVGRDGAVYVSDYDHDRIQKFTAEGEFLLELGRSGSGPSETSRPRTFGTGSSAKRATATSWKPGSARKETSEVINPA